MKVKSLSHVQLSVTPWTRAYQAPLSMGFSRQEYWSGVPLPSPKASGGDGIPIELFQTLKDDAVKVLHSICQQIWSPNLYLLPWKPPLHILATGKCLCAVVVDFWCVCLVHGLRNDCFLWDLALPPARLDTPSQEVYILNSYLT